MVEYSLYRNNNGKVLAFLKRENQTESQYYLREMRRRLNSNANNWNIFMSLTYNNKALEKQSPKDITRMFDRWKAFAKKKIRRLMNHPNCLKSICKKYGCKQRKPYKYKRWNRIYEHYKDILQMKYIWKLEFGNRYTRRAHYHVMLEYNHKISFKRLYIWWGNGRCHFEKITNVKKSIDYINKYFSKPTNLVNQRKWGCSRNIHKIEKKWKYYGKASLEQIQKYNQLKRNNKYNPLRQPELQKLMEKIKKQKAYIREGLP